MAVNAHAPRLRSTPLYARPCARSSSADSSSHFPGGRQLILALERGTERRARAVGCSRSRPSATACRRWKRMTPNNLRGPSAWSSAGKPATSFRILTMFETTACAAILQDGTLPPNPGAAGKWRLRICCVRLQRVRSHGCAPRPQGGGGEQRNRAPGRCGTDQG